MTCIVGVIEGEDVYLGGDSALSTGNEVIAQKQPKVFLNGEFLIGCAGSARIHQLLCYAFVPPERPIAKDLQSYMATDFLDALRKCFKDGGLAHKEAEVESYYGSILIAHRGRLFHLGSNYSLFEADCGYDAVGTGAEVAKGALYATRSLPPEKRVLLALESAAEHVEGVRPPFTIEILHGSAVPGPEEPTEPELAEALSEPVAEPVETLVELRDVPTTPSGEDHRS